MPIIPIKTQKQYEKAIEVLTRVGGTYRGVGQDEWFLVVTPAQYQALLEAKVVNPENEAKDQSRGKSSQKKVKF